MRPPMTDEAISAVADTFPARAGELRRIGTFLNDFCTRQGVGREHCLRLNLVVEELFTNTVRHGHRGDSDAPVWLSVDAEPGEVHIVYEDTAPPFNPYAYLPKARDVGGLGVLLTRGMAESGEYAYLYGRNRTRLTLAA